jgi:DNA-binding NtrC family response regulator
MASILIVDDEKSIRTMLASYVRAVGHEVEIAENGQAALELLGRAAFDVVFSDVRMAELDGIALLKEIRGRWPDILVVLMTAYATVPQAVEAIQAGAYDYLVKPFSINQVGRVLDRALEVRSASPRGSLAADGSRALGASEIVHLDDGPDDRDRAARGGLRRHGPARR